MRVNCPYLPHSARPPPLQESDIFAGQLTTIWVTFSLSIDSMQSIGSINLMNLANPVHGFGNRYPFIESPEIK